LPKAVVRHQGDWRSFVAAARWDRHETYVLVMTHDHHLDLEIIQDVVKRPARYVGLIGSATKWARFRQSLEKRQFTADEIDRVVCPIGLTQGGKAPQEIAISAAAQLLALHYESR
jgi:xanthine dehydrogenase accessory factor